MKKENKEEVGIYAQARITKVKLGKEVCIEYEVEHSDIIDAHKLESPDEPTLEFKAALQELAGDVCEIAEFGEEEEPKIKIHSISLSYKGEKTAKIMSASISASRRLVRTNERLNFLTPSLPEAPKSKKKPDPLDAVAKLPAHAAMQIYIVIDEARKYLNGIRAQTTMSFPKKKEEASLTLLTGENAN